MTKRNPVSSEQNIWYDAEQVDANDLTVEQNYNSTIQTAIINNHLGTGIISEFLQPRILFDSSLVEGYLDGKVVNAQLQPSDNNFGNQLEVVLSDSKAAGNRAVKVCIIGLDFKSNLQYETFTFKTNENQFTKKHYTSILLILINDFSGLDNESFNLGGKILIKEAEPYSLSRSSIMIAQDVQPNLFFRDFYTPTGSLNDLLQTGLPYYNIDYLNIATDPNELKSLDPNDVTTKIGQKFKAYTDNIQKVTLLLSAINPDSDLTNPSEKDFWYDWSGEIVVTIYALQTKINCPTDIPPNQLIEYSPSPIPLAQISFSKSTLADRGIILNDISQPVDFIFSTTNIAKANSLNVGDYYAVTVNRSGASNTGVIYLASGSKSVSLLDPSDSRLTVFNGYLWTDLTNEDLWFQIHTDGAKVSDGQAYQSGNGLLLPKTITDPNNSENTVDYCLDNITFAPTDRINPYTAILFGQVDETSPVQDLRTGNSVYSRQMNSPKVDLLNSNELKELQKTTDTLLLGNIIDKNINFYDESKSTFNAKLFTNSVINNEIFIEDVSVTDPRYDDLIISNNFASGNLINTKIYPDINNSPNVYYRVAKAEKITCLYGDVNGDGIINEEDIDLIKSYVGFDFNKTPPLYSNVSPPPSPITDPVVYENGYETYKNNFIASNNISFYVIDVNNDKVINSPVSSIAADGILLPDPNRPGYANFKSFNNTIIFKDLVPAVGGNKLIIYSDTHEPNKGGFEIIGLDELNNTITIRKILINSDTMMNLFRSNLDGYNNKQITQNDVNLLIDYVNKSYFNNASPEYTNVGKSFSVFKLVLEAFNDRSDDYFDGNGNRNSVVHPISDIIENMTSLSLSNRDMFTTPSVMQFVKQLTWEDYLIVSNTKNKLIPVVFESLTGNQEPECKIINTTYNSYQDKPKFDPGKVDYFVPNNLIIGDHGEIVRNNGELYKNDLEVGTILLEIPTTMYGIERDINLLDAFIAEYTNGGSKGLTRLGFPAMKFADCSPVGVDALEKNQIRFSISVQSFSPAINGVDPNGLTGVIVDDKIGVFIDPKTGLLRLNFTNLYQDEILLTLNTKIQIQVFLKKAGWNNPPLFINSDIASNLLKLNTDKYLGTGNYPGDNGAPVASSISVNSYSVPVAFLSGVDAPLLITIPTDMSTGHFIINSLGNPITLIDLNSPNSVEVVLKTDSDLLDFTVADLKVGNNLYNVKVGDDISFSVYQLEIVYEPIV